MDEMKFFENVSLPIYDFICSKFEIHDEHLKSKIHYAIWEHLCMGEDEFKIVVGNSNVTSILVMHNSSYAEYIEREEEITCDFSFEMNTYQFFITTC